VIAPCKGIDVGLAANLGAVLNQDYPDFEVIFVVDDANDPAVPAIEDAARDSARNFKVVHAKKATDSGQKVENLREAVLHIDSRSEVLTFVDSDVRPGNEWLRSLVAPLTDDLVGASSGYRWFVSENSNFATELRSSWNASIASVQGPDMGSNFCWGGSMAIRRDVFERLNIHEKWRGTLSDDLAVTRSMNAVGLPVYFVPKAVVPSSGTCSFRELLEFTNRQIKITRVYAPRLWITSFLGSGLFTAVMIASLGVVFTDPSGPFARYAALFTIISVTLLSVGKAWLRAKAIRLVLRENRAALDRQFIYQIALWLFTPAIFFINCSAALFSRRITWRGTEYEMTSPTETKVL
jgi:cellulose synthase/poly-beta-1,6-N-acetylglucosamine synthase-like glycosyltransferase